MCCSADTRNLILNGPLILSQFRSRHYPAHEQQPFPTVHVFSSQIGAPAVSHDLDGIQVLFGDLKVVHEMHAGDDQLVQDAHTL